MPWRNPELCTYQEVWSWYVRAPSTGFSLLSATPWASGSQKAQRCLFLAWLSGIVSRVLWKTEMTHVGGVPQDTCPYGWASSKSLQYKNYSALNPPLSAALTVRTDAGLPSCPTVCETFPAALFSNWHLGVKLQNKQKIDFSRTVLGN